MTDVAGTVAPDRDDLVVRHLDLARSLARRFTGRGESLDDLQGVAGLALVRAARNYDAEREVAFATFATVSIVGELKRHFRDRVWAVRAPRRLHDLVMQIGEARETLLQRLGTTPTVADIAVYLECGDEEILEAMEASSAYRADSLDAPLGVDGMALGETLGAEDPALAAQLERVPLQVALGALPADERYLLKAYFFDHRTQVDIGRELACSQMQVSRLLSRVCARLRGELAHGDAEPAT